MSTNETLPVLRLGTRKIAIHYSVGVRYCVVPASYTEGDIEIDLIPTRAIGLVAVLDDNPDRNGYRQLSGYVLIRPAALALQIPVDIAYVLVPESMETMAVVREFSPQWMTIESATRQHADHG